MKINELVTARIRLRQWQEQDFPLFTALNADPQVMEYFPDPLTEEQSNQLARRCESLIAEQGWGFWAVELKSSQQFMGFLGLHKPQANLPFSPCVEIGWRLLKDYWGNGYATEAGNAALRFAFNRLNLKEVVSFTAVSNMRSRAVMERLGFYDTKENFEHPGLPKGHALSEHVLYKIAKSQWLEN